jgi:presenilin 1
MWLTCGVLLLWQVVGMLGLFFMPVPISMKQGYLIVTGIVVAYIFTLIPEWTTWVLLVAMALYDLCAVLTPGGPLKVSKLRSCARLLGMTQ